MSGSVDKILNELNAKRNTYLAQKEQAQANFQQLTGAIFAIEETIKNLESTENEPTQAPALPVESLQDIVEEENAN